MKRDDFRRRAIIAAICASVGYGCALSNRSVVEAALVTDDGDVVATQMLRPGISADACAWGPVWSPPAGVGARALRDAIARVPEADMLRDARVGGRRLHMGFVVRDCVHVSGSAVRRIGQIALPLVGKPHESHH